MLSDVSYLRFDGPVDFIDEVLVYRLPHTGPSPPQARRLLAHHDNTSEKIWIQLNGPTAIEALANEITVQLSPPTDRVRDSGRST